MINRAAPTYLDWYTRQIDQYLQDTGYEEEDGFQAIRRSDMTAKVLNTDGQFRKSLIEAMGFEEEYEGPYVAAFLAEHSSDIEYAAANASEYPGEFHLEIPGDLEPVREYLSIYYPDFADFDSNEVTNMLP